MVTMALLSLIVLALMAVFANTQTAFRATITQTDILESGRATMDMMAADLRGMTPSDCRSNSIGLNSLNQTNNVNFFIGQVNDFVSPPSPLIQPLVGGSQQRTNLLEDFFILSRGNLNGQDSWIGTGYAVNTNLPDGTLYPLYRFYMATNTENGTPAVLFNNFRLFQFTNSAVWSHLMDGVVGLTARAYDPNGYWLTNHVYYTGQYNNYGTNDNIAFSPMVWGEVSATFYSNAVPASVQIEMDTLEDRTLQRAESLGGSTQAQSDYLAGAGSKLHVFRQRVIIPQVDTSVYQ